jgi:hypothetical protein
MPALTGRRLVPLALLALSSLSTPCLAGGTIEPSAIPGDAKPRHLRGLMDVARQKSEAPAIDTRRIVLLPPEECDPEPVPPPLDLPTFRKRVACSEPAIAGQPAVAAISTGPDRPAWLERTRGAVVLCSALAAAGSVWLLRASFKRRDDRLRKATPRTETLDDEAGLLQPLIANRLRIVEETLVLPPLACLHGRPVPSLRYRVDPAQMTGDPHFVPAPSDIPAEMETASWFLEPERVIHQPSYLRRAANRPVRSPQPAEGGL